MAQTQTMSHTTVQQLQVRELGGVALLGSPSRARTSDETLSRLVEGRFVFPGPPSKGAGVALLVGEDLAVLSSGPL